MGVLDVLSGLSTAAGKGYEGYGQDQQIKVKNALAKRQQDEEERRNRVLETVRTPRMPLVTGVGSDGKPIRVEDVPGASVYEAPRPAPPLTTIAGPGGKPVRGADVVGAPVYVAPEKPKEPNLITVPDPKDPGRLVRAPDIPGQEVPGPSSGSGMGGASIKKALAANTSQLAIIDDAVKELEKSPDATGLLRGLPIIGDRLDPRADPGGVAARAQIANIGSLKIHDRSGAAVSVHEFPRLAPFIPSITDPPEAIRTKLAKLRAAIIVETDALRAQGGGQAKSGGVTPDDFTDAEVLAAHTAGKRTDTDIAAWIKAHRGG